MVSGKVLRYSRGNFLPSIELLDGAHRVHKLIIKTQNFPAKKFGAIDTWEPKNLTTKDQNPNFQQFSAGLR
jgi:hypothetical protein